MFTPLPHAAAIRRRSVLALVSLLLNLLPAPALPAAAAARVQSASGSFVRVLGLATNDLVYDAQTRKIFASVPSSEGASGNSIAEIDPAAGSVGPSFFVGSEPNKLALSADGQALYVGLDGALAFRRFDVPTRTPGQQVSLGSHPIEGAYSIGDLAVSPASRDTVAVARVRPFSSPAGRGVVVYDNGVVRPTASSDFNSINELAFSSSEATLYGSSTQGGNLSTLAVNSSGVTITGATTFNVGGEIQFAGGVVYSATGKAVNPSTNTLLGAFAGITTNSPFVVDAGAGRAYYLVNPSTTANQTLTLRAYDLSTLAAVGETTVAGVNGRPSSLVRWGANGLAFRTAGGQLFLVQTALIPSAEPVPAPTPTPAATPSPDATPVFEASVRHLPLFTKDLAYVPSSQSVYASLPSLAGPSGNSLAAIEPATGAVGTPVFVGSEPNKLSLADDGHTLYVGLDGAASVRRFDTATRAAGLQFSLSSAPGPVSPGLYLASDLAAMPGSPGSVAVCRLAGPLNPSTSLSVYDEGVKRPNDSNGVGREIEFSSSPARIYSTVLGFGAGVQRNAVGAAGVSFESATPVGKGGTIRYVNGLLYTGNGSVIEPETGELKGTFALGDTGGTGVPVMLAVDAALGRAYFLYIPSGNQGRLKAFDTNTFLPIGEAAVEVAYTPSSDYLFEASSLVRWGENGLAFRTTSHVILIQSALVGPGAVPAPTPRPSPTPTPAPTPQLPTFVRQIELPVRDVVYSQATQRLYASVAGSAAGGRGNSITEVDPATGAAGASVPAGTEPDKIGLSDDGRVLYFGYDGFGPVRGPGAISRFDILTQTVGPQISLGRDPNFGGPMYAGDLAVEPGNNEVVAVARYTSSSPPQQGVAVFDNGVQRPKTTPGHLEGSTHLAFSETPSKLYGGATDTGMKTMTVDASGVTVNSTTPFRFGPAVEFRGGLLYAASGQVLDPSAGVPRGKFNSSAPGRAMTVDTALGRAFFATGSDGAQITITAYDTGTFTPVGRVTLPFTGTPTRLVRWGVNGLALRAATSTISGAEGRLYVVQSALVSTAAPVPTGVQLAPTPLTAQEGQSFVAFNVIRTGDLSVASTVDYETQDGTASERQDYTTALGTLRFAPGESSKTVRVLLSDDTYQEGAETFTVTVGGATGALLTSPAAATVTIQDNDFSTPPENPSDGSAFFVRQHYRDFLNRSADAPGLAFWVNEIESCGADQQCREVKRVNVSAAFFRSIEFQETGFLAYRVNQAAYGTGETLGMRAFLKDTQEMGSGVVVGQGAWQEQLEANKRDFFARFVARPEFLAAYPATLPAANFVDALDAHTHDPAQPGAGGSLTQAERDQLVSELSAGTRTRADVLRAVAENALFRLRQTNRAFVYMQYVGYLRRNPNATPDTDYAGYNFWLGKLEEFHGNYVAAEMVKAFITSIEYRKRFAP